MYSVVQIGAHQFMVQPGDIIDVQKLENQEGESINLDQVLFVGGEAPLIGKPTVSGATVKAQVIRQGRERKKIVFIRKAGLTKKKRGHRQPYTGLLITEISNGQGKSVKIDTASKNATKYLK
jgi:large subunit ribosomal protein L21